MSLIFDTSVLIGIEKADSKVLNKLNELFMQYPGQPQVAFISYFEYLDGLQNKSIKNKTKALSFINKFGVISTTKRTAELLVEIKKNMESKGLLLPLADLLIASQTIENQGVLVTTDTDFTRIDGLKHVLIA